MKLEDAMAKDRDNLAHRVKATGELTFAHKSGLRLATVNNKIVAIKSNGKIYDDWKPGCTGWKQNILTFIADPTRVLPKRAAVKANAEAKDRKIRDRAAQAEALAIKSGTIVYKTKTDDVKPGKVGLQYLMQTAWGLRAEIAVNAASLEDTGFDKPELKHLLKKILNDGHALYEML